VHSIIARVRNKLNIIEMKKDITKEIRRILYEHIGNVNSFVDSDGRNHLDDCIKDLNALFSEIKGESSNTLINTERLDLKTWDKVPKDADYKWRVLYQGDGYTLAGCGNTEQEAIINFCKTYLKKYAVQSDTNYDRIEELRLLFPNLEEMARSNGYTLPNDPNKLKKNNYDR